MARSREEFSSILKTVDGLAYDPILEDLAVYFQPGPTSQMVYPCIVYQVDRLWDTKADNINYLYHTKYNVVVIDRNPDSTIPQQIMNRFSMCVSDRNYPSDNLHHYVLTIYF